MKNHNLFLTPDYRYRLPESNFKKLILSLIILLSFVHVAAQNNINISGTVVDDQGEAVIGASVVAQKSKNGTITDVEGNFKLSVRSNDVLTISFIGYITQTVPVSGKNNIVVTLKENSIAFEKIIGLLITHDHADHIKSAGCLGEKYGIPVYTTSDILAGMNRSYCMSEKIYSAGRIIHKEVEFTLRDFELLLLRSLMMGVIMWGILSDMEIIILLLRQIWGI